MSKKIISILILLGLYTTSCGPYKVQVEGPTNPIEVNLGINLDTLTQFFYDLCKSTMSVNTSEDTLNACANGAVNNFLSKFNLQIK